MVLHEWNESNPPIKFEIIATDISISALKTASRGVYTESDVEPVPLAMRKKYLLRSSSDDETVKISKHVRSKVSFSILNFQDKVYGLDENVDIIFCRNALIYFDKKNQQDIINRFCRVLVHRGHLFLGHSESILGLDVSVEMVGPTTYKKFERVTV